MNSPLDNPTFRTKTGFCSISPDAIILSRVRPGDGAIDTMREKLRRHPRLILGLFGIVAVVAALFFAMKGRYPIAFVCAVIGIYYLWIILRSRRLSASPIIDRDTIRSITAHPPNPPLTRGHFIVTFVVDEDERKRLIALPGSLHDGGEEWERAIVVMAEAGIVLRQQS